MLRALSSIFLIAAVIIFLNMDLSLPKQKIQIQTSNKTYNLIVEVAKKREDMEKGLMGRSTMTMDEGMLFVYESPVIPSYWMKNMEIPIDIFFINSENKIEHIEKALQPCDDECELYSSDTPIKYVLELRAGFADEYGVEIGDKLVYDEISD